MSEVKDNKENLTETQHNMSNLNEVSDFSNNEVDNIEILEKLYENPETKYNVNLSHNLIMIIPESFYTFSNLKYLDLSYNKLVNIDNLRFCTKIETLKLAHNDLKFTRAVVYLKVLQSLDLSYNKLIIDQVLIKNLRGNSELLSLKLEGNAKYNFENLKNYCLESLTKLLYLDSHKISNSSPKKYQPVFVNVHSNDGQVKKFKKLSEYIKLMKPEAINRESRLETQIETKPIEKRYIDTRADTKETIKDKADLSNKKSYKNSTLEKLRKENESLMRKLKPSLYPINKSKYKQIERPKSQFKGKAAIYNMIYLDPTSSQKIVDNYNKRDKSNNQKTRNELGVGINKTGNNKMEKETVSSHHDAEFDFDEINKMINK